MVRQVQIVSYGFPTGKLSPLGLDTICLTEVPFLALNI